MAKPIIATPDAIVGPGIDALVAQRPRALRFVNYPTAGGTYAKVFAGWRAQAALCLRRQAAEVAAARLPFAKGDELLDLAADEYSTVADLSPTKAMGHVILTRGAGGNGGAIRKGTRFRRDADDTQIPAVHSATYAATRDTPLLQGATLVTVPIEADRAGLFANAPIVNGVVQGVLQLADTLFDPTVTVRSYAAGGGGDQKGDADLRAEAQAFSTGQFAPTKDAILAGALRGTGVAHVAYFDVTKILGTIPGQLVNAAFAALVVADSSWGWSPEWVNQIAQLIAGDANDEGFLGFGCKLVARGPNNNQTITVQPTVLLRDAAYLSDTSTIDAKIQAAVVDYFDNRPDWYTFRAAQLRAAIARADRRILTCPAVTVADQTSGTPLADPPQPIFSAAGAALTHWLVGEGAVSTTYSAPS